MNAPASLSSYDCLIVGQGLAGTILAWLLIGRGCRVLVADSHPERAASRAAAGIVNPVTGRRWVKTAGAERCLPMANRLYAAFERRFHRSFFHPKGFIRLLRSEADYAIVRKRLADPAYRAYLGLWRPAGSSGHAIDDRWGSVEQFGCGHLDMGALLDTMRAWLRRKDCLVETSFRCEQLEREKNSLFWCGREVHRIVFCEGAQAADNPWFGWLPFQCSKGKILTLTTEVRLPAKIIHREQWLLPLHEGIFKFGATYRWPPFGPEPDGEASEFLLARLHALYPPAFDAKVIGQQCGIRPGTRDKQPFIGTQPSDPRLLIFNGFGSKGALLIPWYAQRMVAFMLNGAPLPAHADIRRFYAKQPVG